MPAYTKPTDRFPGFVHNGTHIDNPTASECGRFAVSPEHYGFTITGTGGNCTGWTKDIAEGRLLITDADGCSHDLGKPGDYILVGLYDPADGTEWGMWEMQVGLTYSEDDYPFNIGQPATEDHP